jgi:branched-chain amino acid transport system substrate-binding protein
MESIRRCNQLEGGKPVLQIVENGDHTDIPLTGEMKPIG